jgi:hypothetical protein
VPRLVGIGAEFSYFFGAFMFHLFRVPISGDFDYTVLTIHDIKHSDSHCVLCVVSRV